MIDYMCVKVCVLSDYERDYEFVSGGVYWCLICEEKIKLAVYKE